MIVHYVDIFNYSLPGEVNRTNYAYAHTQYKL